MFQVNLNEGFAEFWVNKQFAFSWYYDTTFTETAAEEMKKRLEKHNDPFEDINRDRDTQLFTMRLLKEFADEKA